MRWFGRKRNSGDAGTAEAGVASDLGDFLVSATEGRALRQAIGVAGLHPSEKQSPTPPVREAVTGITAGTATFGLVARPSGERE